VQNRIVIDHHASAVIDKQVNVDLFHLPKPLPLPVPKMKLREKFKKTTKDCKAVAAELKAVWAVRRARLEAENLFEPVKPVNIVTAVCEQVEVLVHWDELNK
jgi:hypothetical protein